MSKSIKLNSKGPAFTGQTAAHLVLGEGLKTGGEDKKVRRKKEVSMCVETKHFGNCRKSIDIRRMLYTKQFCDEFYVSKQDRVFNCL